MRHSIHNMKQKHQPQAVILDLKSSQNKLNQRGGCSVPFRTYLNKYYSFCAHPVFSISRFLSSSMDVKMPFLSHFIDIFYQLLTV